MPFSLAVLENTNRISTLKTATIVIHSTKILNQLQFNFDLFVTSQMTACIQRLKNL